jgi:hypothetical protein
MAYMTFNECSKSNNLFLGLLSVAPQKMEPLHLRPELSAAWPTLKYEESKATSAAASRSWWDPPRARGQVPSNPGAALPPTLPHRTMTHDATRLEKLDPVGEEVTAPWWRAINGAMVVSSVRWTRSPLLDLR